LKEKPENINKIGGLYQISNRENDFKKYHPSIVNCESDPLSPPEGKAPQGERPLDPLFDKGFPVSIISRPGKKFF
jgi:hypothetical protein